MLRPFLVLLACCGSVIGGCALLGHILCERDRAIAQRDEAVSLADEGVGGWRSCEVRFRDLEQQVERHLAIDDDYRACACWQSPDMGPVRAPSSASMLSRSDRVVP